MIDNIEYMFLNMFLELLINYNNKRRCLERIKVRYLFNFWGVYNLEV